MKSLEKGQDKVQKICDLLRKQTIEPALIEAEAILEEAKLKSEEIKKEAEKYREHIIQQAKLQIEQQQNVFQSSLQQAAKQTIEFLKQEVEHRFFNEELQVLFAKPLNDPRIISELIQAVVRALEKEGINADLSVAVSRAVSVDDVSALLAESVRQKLRKTPIEIKDIHGGAQISLVGKKMTLDLSEEALRELVARYVRKDFRKLIFSH